jgi:tetrahydromethanopterin S-methyltransferase subunit G
MNDDVTKDLSPEEEPTADLSDSEKLTQILKRLPALESKLGALDAKVEERLQDTRPIWARLEQQMGEVIERLSSIESKLDALAGDILKAWGDITRLDRRVSALEPKSPAA